MINFYFKKIYKIRTKSTSNIKVSSGRVSKEVGGKTGVLYMWA